MMFTKRVPNENKTSMTPINSFADAKVFSGRIVAFKTTAIYFGVGQGYKLDESEIRYAVISESFVQWINNERGYSMAILLNPKNLSSNNALIDSKLKDACMQMRLVTNEEVLAIKEAVIDGKAKFEFMSDKDKMVDLLDNEIKKYNSAIKLSR